MSDEADSSAYSTSHKLTLGILSLTIVLMALYIGVKVNQHHAVPVSARELETQLRQVQRNKVLHPRGHICAEDATDQ